MDDKGEDGEDVSKRRPKRVGRRKLVKRVKKRGRYESKTSSASETGTETSSSQAESSRSSFPGEESDTSQVSLGELSVSSGSAARGFQIEQETILQQPVSEQVATSSAPSSSSVFPVTDDEPSLHVIHSILENLKKNLPQGWVPIAVRDGVHLLLLSEGRNKVSQRNIFMSFTGEYSVMVHCSLLPNQETILGHLPSRGPSCHQEQAFCQFLTDIAKNLNQYQVCPGASDSNYSEMWKNVKDSVVDSNPYREKHFEQTCRSLSCSLLILLGNVARCPSCSVLQKNIKRRGLPTETFHSSTPNIHLSERQKKLKLKLQGEELEKRRRKIERLEKKVNELLEAESVCVDPDLDRDLHNIFKQGNISEVQQCFLEQQIAASKVGPKQMRWHPIMIRFALHLKMVSSAAYDSVRESGLIKLPCSRTLFDYTHASKSGEGVDQEAIKSLNKKIKMKERSYQDFCVLMCDEMHVSQNLVYSKSDGSLVGYVKLDAAEKEMVEFDKFVSGDESTYKPSPPLASKILSFKVKGVAMSVKEVVASFTSKKLTKDQLYVKSWQVISALEKSSVKVVAFVCDGSAVNRAFMKMHCLLTVLKSGLVFDTSNFCSPEGRPLFFISDAAHLLKTIRNCFHNSGNDSKKSRCMTRNGEKIVWRHIVRLFNLFKRDTLRKTHKLNSQTVFLNSYSCMSVKLAARVMSKTVALDLQSQNWPQTVETVKFILMVNDFFDCLNGAHSSQAIRTLNENLAPYSSVNDKRLAENGTLMNFLKYLQEWKDEVQQLGISDKEKAKLLLSYQTLEGIEITVMGFRGAVKYLLQSGVEFINARVFSQDPLEQYFSKQRARGGGSSNPDVSRFFAQKDSIRVQGETGPQRKRGNTEAEATGMEMPSEKMKRRKSKQTTLFNFFTKC